jgi:hypothetical protein
MTSNVAVICGQAASQSAWLDDRCQASMPPSVLPSFTARVRPYPLYRLRYHLSTLTKTSTPSCDHSMLEVTERSLRLLVHLIPLSNGILVSAYLPQPTPRDYTGQSLLPSNSYSWLRRREILLPPPERHSQFVTLVMTKIWML